MINKIVLFGSNGFVGTNFLNDTRALNYKVYAPSKSEVNLFNKSEILNYLKLKKPDLIINTAGKVGGILVNSENNFSFLNENILLNYNLINSSKELRIKNYINLSSSCIYPKDKNNLLKESDILNGKLEETNEGYALAKIFALKSCYYLSKQFNYKTIIPCNLYGPFDDFNHNTSHMIPGVISRVHEAKINNKKHVQIWGNGGARREFMYIEDFIDFLYFALRNFNQIPNILNVGLGYDFSIIEYYNQILSLLDYKGKLLIDNTKPSGIKQKLMDISLLQTLGWKSKTSLYQGLKLTYKFYLENYGKL